jgi:hypothetical protein
VFDTLVQLVIKRVPLKHAATSLADHYVRQYAPAIDGGHVEEALTGLHLDPTLVAHAIPAASPPRLVQPLHTLAHG